MKNMFKKLLLPIIGFSTIVVSVPIILTNCAKITNSNIIDFDKYTSIDNEGVTSYEFFSLFNDEWKNKNKDQIYKELNLKDDLLGTQPIGVNLDFKNIVKFKSIINTINFITKDDKNLLWTDINVSALINPNSETILVYWIQNNITYMAIDWRLDSKISVSFYFFDTPMMK